MLFFGLMDACRGFFFRSTAALARLYSVGGFGEARLAGGGAADGAAGSGSPHLP